MTLFAEGGECRHAGILTYFRDSERLKRCGHCDICAPQSSWVVPIPEKPVKPAKVRRAKEKVAIYDKLETEGSELRAEHLREWRKTYADSKDIPAFIVFSNRTMVDLANKDPRTLEELKRVYGFGDAKIEAIGQIVLDELAHLR
jgi:ATP-dependent DNA helicase RecQ